MDTISAIETSYKGYRFRSRLEARWAMFFHRVGVTWTHEPQPLRVAGEPYLPDFLVSLPGGDVVHEVKSLHEWERIQPKSAYLAGKMAPEHEWRGEAALLAPEDCEVDGGLDWTWRRKANMAQIGGVTFKMRGPFRVTGQHGTLYHDDAPGTHNCEQGLRWFHGNPLNDAVITACRNAIEEATLFCAHISTGDEFGTLVEIGYASALRRPICVTMRAGLDARDYWFAMRMADRSHQAVRDDEEARAFHGAFIRDNTPREYRLISGIGAERAAAMTFGDPLDVANRGQVHDWGGGIRRLCIANRAAAEAVRAHRFDGR